MRLFNNQFLAGFFQPDFGKVLINIAVKLAGRVIGYIQQPHFFGLRLRIGLQLWCCDNERHNEQRQLGEPAPCAMALR